MTPRTTAGALASLVIAISALVAPRFTPALAAKDPNQAALIVRAADGGTDAMCVAFDEPSITGAELLQRSGVDYVAESSSIGTALCAIDGDGCAKGDCFCEYPSFWGYWVRDPDDAKWRFSDVGAAEREVLDGSMDAWSFGKDGKPAPKISDFGGVCDGSETVRATSSADTQRLRSPRPNYVMFAALAAAFAAAAVAVTRRRTRR